VLIHLGGGIRVRKGEEEEEGEEEGAKKEGSAHMVGAEVPLGVWSSIFKLFAFWLAQRQQKWIIYKHTQASKQKEYDDEESGTFAGKGSIIRE